MKKIYTGVFCCILISIQSFSQTWNGSVSSDWNTATNWTPNNVPSTSGNVIINSAVATYQPILPGNVSIRTLNMSAGFLNLNGSTLTCSVSATLTGDSLYNGKISSATFNDLSNMHMGGKIILDRTGSANEWWQGKNKFYGDSLTIIWRSGSLYMENAASSPDSIFGNLKLVYSDNNPAVYRINLALNSPIYIQNDLILDNPDKGTFGLDYANEKRIGGNIKTINFSNAVPNFPLSNVIVLGSDANGPFYSHTASIDNCSFNGNFSLVADSNVNITIHNSSFLGADNLFQAGNIDAYGNKFGKAGSGVTILKTANNLGYIVYERTGNNKFVGNAQWETYAVYPTALTMQHNWYGPDTCLQDLNFVLKGNAALTTNGNGHNYVAGNVIIDGQGSRKWVEFTGGAGNDFVVNGSFTAKNFSASAEPGVGITSVILHNVTTSGTDSSGTFYCTNGTITDCIFNGNFKLIADSSLAYFIDRSSFLGTDNLFQAGITQAVNSKFGHIGAGTTVLRSALNSGSNYMRDGNNKFFNNVQFEPYAVYPAGVTIQQNYFGADSCWGNMNYILKGNTALGTNSSGNNWVAGNMIIDAQGARKWIEFTGGGGNTFTVEGNLNVKNFTTFYEPGITYTDVFLHNLYVKGSDTVGTIYCRTGNIQGSSFKGGLKLIADSNYVFGIYSSSLLGADNLIQSGSIDFNGNQFGQMGTGTTILRGAYNDFGSLLMRDGNNKFWGHVNFETYALYPGSFSFQQTYYGPDSSFSNMNFVLKGNSFLATNTNGFSYVAGNLTIDGQGARKWIQFAGGNGVGFNVAGNFTVKNFTPFSEPGAGPTNVYLHGLSVAGSDTCGTFYCSTGDINGASFNGNFKLIADSSQQYGIYNSMFAGADNFFQAGNFDVNNNKFGHLNTGTTTFKQAHNIGGTVYMGDGNNKFFGDAEWFAVPPFNGSAVIRQSYMGPDTCLGNVLINLVGASSANLATSNLYIGKGLSLVNNGSGVIVHDNGGTAIHFIGTDTASYLFSGSGSSPSFINIEMNRRGGLRLMSPLSFTGTLQFTRGIILSSVSNPLQIPNSAIISSAWDSSYVDGPVRKTGNTPFTFPLGRNNVYAPLGITAPSSNTDVFTAQYFNHLANADGYDSTQHDVSLNHLSRKEFWMLGRTAGTSNVKVTLSWKTSRSSIVNSINDLRVAHWNGSTWKDEGNGGTTGNDNEGTIQSLNTISSFSPFTLASTSTSNPLPVQFISFKIHLNPNNTVSIQWLTANEINNDHFEVQRSGDLFYWTNLQTVVPISTGNYSYVDVNPVNGSNYYRIKQVDIDATISYTEVRMINIQNLTEISVWPNPIINELNLQLPFSKGLIEITDEAGRILLTSVINANHMVIQTEQLKNGTYFLRIRSNERLYVRKFIKL